MTQVDFYTHVDDKLHTMCTLAAKALARKMRVLILTPDPQTTEQVDRMLWIQPAIGFLPHCRSGHRLAAITPIIVDHVAEPIVHEQLLINLHAECPPVFSRFERVMEIVTTDEADREAARGRYRFYRDRGYEIRSHDMSKAAN
jgi:DNA polymerase III subunit chi